MRTPKTTRKSKRKGARTVSRQKKLLPKVPGGKALARIHLYQLQREPKVKSVSRKISKPIASQLVRQKTKKRRTKPQSRSTDAGASSYYVSAFQAVRQMLAKPMLRGAAAATTTPTWRPLGPFSIPHGQTYGEGSRSRPSVAGRVSSVAINPTDAAHILIGAAGGGIWETRDHGLTWAPRSDFQPSLSIGAVKFDPNDPNIAYAGTGEGDSRATDLAAGLFRSTNGGTDWVVHATDPFEDEEAFFDLLIDETDSNHILAACTGGLYRSTDGGANWVRELTESTYSLSMTVKVDGSREFLAATFKGLFRSTSGATWSKITLTGSPSTFDRLEVAHAPSEGSIVIVSGANGSGFLWRRASFGSAFAKISMPGDIDVGQAWYDWFAAIAPNNPDVMYLGAIDMYRGERTLSGDWDWENVSAKIGGDCIHPDQHAIAFNPFDGNDLIVGNDGGVFRSIDGGTSWTSLNRGLNITEFEYLAQHPEYESWLIAGTQDNGTLRYQNQQVWYLVQDGDGGDCGVDSSQPKTCYHSFYGMYLERSTKGGAWNSWTSTGLPYSQNDEGLFYPPVEVNGSVVVKASNTVYVSRSRATPGSWDKINLPGTRLATALSLPDKKTILVGTRDGRMYKLTFTSATDSWSTVQLGTPRSGYVSDIITDPTDSDRIWATYSNINGGHVFRSDDAGASWTDVSVLLPDIPVNSIEIDPNSTDTVFVAADVGVFRSDDAGLSWTAFNQGLPNALVKDLLFHPESRLLRAATKSRGVWEIQVDSSSQPEVEIYVRDNVIDSGRVTPSPTGVDNPYNIGEQVFWWESPDIKIDSPSFESPNIDDLDYVVFEDDQSMLADGIEFSTGLQSESGQAAQVSRVYVQVHNRGVKPAVDVDVRVFFTEASALFPNLPNGFWTGFPNNTVSASSPWQPVADHRTIPEIAPGRSKVIGFNWALPSSFSGQASLLSIVSASNDDINTTELNIDALVQANKKCAVKSALAINPLPLAGPVRAIVPIQIPTRSKKAFTIRTTGKRGLIRGLILPKTLIKREKASLVKLALTEQDQEELSRLVERYPKLKSKLDLKHAYTCKSKSRKAALLDTLKKSDLAEGTLIVVLNRKKVKGSQSLIVENAAGKPVGGFKFSSFNNG